MSTSYLRRRRFFAAFTQLLCSPSRRLYFDELVGRAADRAAKEEKRRARAAEAFRDLLRSTKGIDVDTSWDDAMVLLASDRDYQAVSAGRSMLAWPQAASAARSGSQLQSPHLSHVFSRMQL